MQQVQSGQESGQFYALIFYAKNTNAWRFALRWNCADTDDK